MHIPDGFLDTKTALAAGTLAAAGLGTALRHARRHLPPRKIPLVGLTAAFIFVAQMLNFPVAGGTSGHLIGATLSVVLLGPGVSVIVMSSVLIIQALLFADGGLVALGANILNMAVVAPVCSYTVYRLMRRMLPDNRGLLVCASVAAWCSTVLAALFCAGELAWSGTASGSVVFPAMAGLHAVIGIGEGLITMLVLAAFAKSRPELLGDRASDPAAVGTRSLVVYGIVVILGLLFLVLPFASKFPDGLERVAQSIGFEQKKIENTEFLPPLRDYRFFGLESGMISAAAAGLFGAAVVFGVSFVLARVLLPARNSPAGSGTSGSEEGN